MGEYLPSHQELLAVVEYCIYFGTTSNSPLPIQPSSINMKLLSGVVALGLLPLALANSILVTYPKDTPDAVIDSAKDSVKKAGGTITHEYSLVIKGFSADAPE